MNASLRAALAETGRTAESLAEEINVDPKTVRRWLREDRVPHPRHRAAAATALGKDIEDIWPDTYRRREPAWFRPWAEIEREAVALRWFEPAWVPGLLQTEAYAYATLAGERITPDGLDRMVASRMRRQGVLHGENLPLLVAVLDEAVLTRLSHAVPELAREQLGHLARCAALPTVSLHVVPARAGLYPGLGGPFILAETREGSRVAYADSQLSAQIVADPADVATLAERWERIRNLALPADLSLELIEEAAT